MSEGRTIRWPGFGNVLRQGSIVAVVVLLWAGAFRFAMSLPGGDRDTPVAESGGRGSAPERIVGGEGGDGDEASVPVTQSPRRFPVAQAPAAERGPAADDTARTETSPPASAATDPENDPPASSSGLARETTSEPGGSPGAQIDPDPLRALDESRAATGLPATDDLPDVSFASDVMPIFERRCVKCHGAPRADGTPRLEEGLDLRSWEAVMAGSTWGSVVEPGDPVGSYLLELVAEGDMPDDGPRLLPREIRVLTAWIASGAPRN